jgi:hypothetical protein
LRLLLRIWAGRPFGHPLGGRYTSCPDVRMGHFLKRFPPSLSNDGRLARPGGSGRGNDRGGRDLRVAARGHEVGFVRLLRIAMPAQSYGLATAPLPLSSPDAACPPRPPCPTPSRNRINECRPLWTERSTAARCERAGSPKPEDYPPSGRSFIAALIGMPLRHLGISTD